MARGSGGALPPGRTPSLRGRGRLLAVLGALPLGIGAEICRGALMTGRPLRLGPLRSETLSRSSDMAAGCGHLLGLLDLLDLLDAPCAFVDAVGAARERPGVRRSSRSCLAIVQLQR